MSHAVPCLQDRMKLGPLRTLVSWTEGGWFILRYLLSQAGIGRAQHVDQHMEACTDMVDTALGLYRFTHFVHGDRVPREGPLIIAGSHAKLDDPLQIFHALRLATGKKRHARAMMRDDFFAGRFFQSRLFNAVEFFNTIGAHPISREGVSLAQMRFFVDLLTQDQAFIMFPGRTRTCSGFLIEYREGFTEIGGMSFFVRQAQRRNPDKPVAVLPVVRNYNPVTRRTAVVFGQPRRLDTQGKEAAREFDAEIIQALGELVEVSVPHILAAIFYLRALHNRNEAIEPGHLEAIIRVVYESAEHPHLEDLGDRALTPYILRAARYFQRHNMLNLERETIHLKIPAILAVPPLDSGYQKRNPVKYLANQIVHLGEITRIIEDAVLSAS